MRDGVALAHIDDLLPSTGAYLENIQTYAKQVRPFAKGKNSIKTHFLYLMLGDISFTRDNPVLQFALARPILDMMNAYMGMATTFHSAEFILTLSVGDALPISSQQWHRDAGDKKICRTFLYASDVDETSGPFIYVKGSHYRGKWRGVSPQSHPAGGYPPIHAVERTVPVSDIMTCLGRAGTIIFADTAGLHKGGYIKEGERQLLSLGYSSGAALDDRKFTVPEIDKSWDDVQKFAIGPEKPSKR